MSRPGPLAVPLLASLAIACSRPEGGGSASSNGGGGGGPRSSTETGGLGGLRGAQTRTPALTDAATARPQNPSRPGPAPTNTDQLAIAATSGQSRPGVDGAASGARGARAPAAAQDTDPDATDPLDPTTVLRR